MDPQRTMRISRCRPPRAPAMTVLVVIGLLVTGCGGGGSSSNGQRTPAGRSTGPADDQAVKYAQCMRENGVANFPDPVNGNLVLRQGAGAPDPNSPEFQSAQQACKSQAPAGAQSGPAGDPGAEARIHKFAKCMRKHGIPDFPDPKVSGGGVQMQIPPGVDPNSPRFASAQRACANLNPLAGLGGTP
jgi:hypothetical protein